jgi:hypothetical protein
MLTAQSLPAIVKALRLLHEAVNNANTHVRHITARVKTRKEFKEFIEAEAAERQQHYGEWGVVVQRAYSARKLLGLEPNGNWLGGGIADLDPALPVEQRARLKDVWEQLGSHPVLQYGNRDRLLLFLKDSIALLTPGGPKKPGQFEWQGHVCGDLTLHDMMLLTFLWNDGRRRYRATFEELRDDFWGGNVVDSTIRSRVSRCNTKLEEAHIFIGLGTEKYTVVCTWGE